MVRKAKASDSAAICKICGEDLGYTCGIELVQSKMKKLDDSREIVFIAEINNMVVGFVHAEKYDVLYYDTMVNILGLAVAEEYRHKGIGSLLLKAVEQWSEEKNIHFVRLILEPLELKRISSIGLMDIEMTKNKRDLLRGYK